MQHHFSNTINALKKIVNVFDEETTEKKIAFLKVLSALPLPGRKQMLIYHDLLLFTCAYPGNKKLKQLAEKELKRIAAFSRKYSNTNKALIENEGLPFTNTVTRFSPDFLSWLLMHKDLQVQFDSFYNPSLSLNNILNITLPAVLKAETTAGLQNEDLLEVLKIKPTQYVPFLLGQLRQLDDRPLLQELFIERMDLYVKLVPKNRQFSRAFNRIPVKQVFYQHDLLKKFNPEELFDKALPKVTILGNTERVQLYKVIKNAMALTVREIDPATFLQVDTMRLYNLERGLTLAVYSMLPQRQLPLETYFGFTFLKNGIPVSYGGVWTFGHRAKIGLNIFDPFRGGESGYLLCQLLRVFKQHFGVRYFEIEPSQFGLDNPDGIKSGAFWFYYKYGFKPVDIALKALAENEQEKIKTKKNYRSTGETLLRFTESSIGVLLEGNPPLSAGEVQTKILSAINKSWQNNYSEAREKAKIMFCNKTQIDSNALTAMEKNVLEEMALWAFAMNIHKQKQLQLMKKMVFEKTANDYAYQQL
ncbi:MAG: hypothetical protein ABIO05_01515, partial [Ferruginibacter sp.]